MKYSQTQRAVDFLKENNGEAYTPDTVRELCNLACTGATLARKMRAKCNRFRPQSGELIKSYYTNSRGEEIARYAYNTERIME